MNKDRSGLDPETSMWSGEKLDALLTIHCTEGRGLPDPTHKSCASESRMMMAGEVGRVRVGGTGKGEQRGACKLDLDSWDEDMMITG